MYYPVRYFSGRPGEPGKPEILKKSRTCVEIGWSAPLHTGNQLITGYTIELARKGQYQQKEIFSRCRGGGADFQKFCQAFF